MDYEAQYRQTTEYVEQTMASHPDILEVYPVSYTHLDVYKRQILGYTILATVETPGLGVKADTWFQEGGKGNIIGRNPGEKELAVSKDGGDIDAITASTITSRAFLNAVNAAYQAFKGNTSDAASGASVQAGRVENATGTGSDSIH